MNAQERQLIEELFDRLARLEAAPRDREAEAAILRGLGRAPNAPYALVQTVLVQEEALRRANDRIEELEGRAPAEAPSGGFLDSMRGALFGGRSSPRGGSVPNIRSQESRPVWNRGEAPADPRYGGQPGYGAPVGQAGGGGGSFLGTAAATAAGVIGGAMLMNSIRGLMGGGGNQSLADTGSASGGEGRTGGSDQSDSNLAREAGIDDIGRGDRQQDDGGSRHGLFDHASNEDHGDDGYDGGFDGGDGDSA